MNMSTDKVKKVVIAIDYNQTAQKVAEVGFSIAKAMNAEMWYQILSIILQQNILL